MDDAVSAPGPGAAREIVVKVAELAVGEAGDVLVTIGSVEGAGTTVSPNTGQLFSVGALGVDVTSGGLDVADDGPAFALINAAGGTGTQLYTINTGTGAATLVGTVGNGKGLGFVEENLARLGCREDREPGANARRLAVLCAAAVWCGELSLLAAQTNPGELMAAHLKLERSAQTAAGAPA